MMVNASNGSNLIEKYEKNCSSEDGKFLYREDLEFLASTELFDIIPDCLLCSIIHCFEIAHVKHGTRFISQGEEGDAMFLIQEGTCLVNVEKDGKEHRIARLGPGDVAGEMAIITGEPRACHVSAETDMKLWRISKKVFDALVEYEPDLRVFLTEILAKRIESTPVTAEKRVGKFIVKDKIGKGGWSIVYRGVHSVLDMGVAIKMMRHDMAMEPLFMETFRREAEITARLSHENIVQLYDIEEAFQTVFIVMEYLEGRSLEETIKNQGRLSHDDALDILLQACNGLAYAHENNIVHRDIKPANIFRCDNGVVKLVDFGLASSPGYMQSCLKGTLKYCAPEQLNSNNSDARTDVFSLGLTAFEMYTGVHPFKDLTPGGYIAGNGLAIPDPRDFVRDMDSKMREFIIKSCMYNPEKRFKDAGSALKFLSGIAESRTAKLKKRLKKKRMTSIMTFYDNRQLSDLSRILEDFRKKAESKGLKIKVSDFHI